MKLSTSYLSSTACPLLCWRSTRQRCPVFVVPSLTVGMFFDVEELKMTFQQYMIVVTAMVRTIIRSSFLSSGSRSPNLQSSLWGATNGVGVPYPLGHRPHRFLPVGAIAQTKSAPMMSRECHMITSVRHIWITYRHCFFILSLMIVIIRDLPLTWFLLWNH